MTAVAAFAVGAVAAGAAAGALLGLAGATVAAGRSGVWAAAAVAGVYALAEAGLWRAPVPQLRRQVPRAWRERLPLPVTAAMYGAGLGVGFVTYVPVATLAAVAGALVLADPGAGAAAMAAFGAGRAAGLLVATARLRTWDEAADRFDRMGRWLRVRGGRLRTANALALGALAGTLAAAAPVPAAAAVQVDLGSSHVADPSVGPPGVIAWNLVTSGGLQGRIRVNGVVSDLPGVSPDIDGSRVVVDTGPAFEILDTTTLAVQKTVTAAGDEPALSGKWLVYRAAGSRRTVVLYDLTTDTSKVIGSYKLRSDVGAPDVSGRRVVYHVTGQRESRVLLYRTDTRTTRTLVTTPVWSLGGTAVSGNLVVYVKQTLDGMSLHTIDLTTDASRLVYALRKRSGRFLWSTATNGLTAWFTIYTPSTSTIWHA
jgi:hypothetical protein